MKSGRTNDEVRDAPAASWSGGASWAGATDDEVAALDGFDRSGRWSLGDRTLRLARLDDVLVPPAPTAARSGASDALTRRDVIRHHAVTAPALLAYLADRPLDLDRLPGGVGTRPVRPRTIPATAPGWVRRWSDGRREHVVADDAATLAWLASWDVLELRPWTSTIADPDRPTWAHLDIVPDPSGPPTTPSSRWPGCTARRWSTWASTVDRC